MSNPSRVLVFNDSETPHTEFFKGDKITIPGKGYIEMEFYDAHEFKGQFYPAVVNADGGQDERSFKRIRIAPVGSAPKIEMELKPTCNACKYEATSKEDLEEHIDANHLEQLEDKEVADKRRKAKKSA